MKQIQNQARCLSPSLSVKPVLRNIKHYGQECFIFNILISEEENKIVVNGVLTQCMGTPVSASHQFTTQAPGAHALPLSPAAAANFGNVFYSGKFTRIFRLFRSYENCFPLLSALLMQARSLAACHGSQGMVFFLTCSHWQATCEMLWLHFLGSVYFFSMVLYHFVFHLLLIYVLRPFCAYHQYLMIV